MSDYVVIQTDPQTTVVLSGVVGTGEKGDPGSPGTGYPTRVAMAGFAATNLDDANLTEAGREGLFIFSAANLSAAVTSDPLQGVYVPPTSDTTGASGAWIRQDKALTPEMFGALGNGTADDTAALRACVTLANTVGREVLLEPDSTYIVSSEIIVPVGVNIQGPRSATVKLKTQVSTTTTASITSGTGAKTFAVTSTTGFAVGQSVMLSTGATISPNDSYSHAGRQISAISGSDITIAAGPNVQAHASGAILATTSHIFLCQGNNVLEGFTVDGNEANNTYGHWVTSSLIVQEGDHVIRRGLRYINTPSDAVLAGGPSGGEIKGSWDVDSVFENIGGNGVHYGNIRDCYVRSCRGKLGNVRYALPVEQAGGASARLGHQDGFVSLSDNVNDVFVTGNTGDNWISGVGAVSTSGSNVNDNVVVDGNTWIDCSNPIEVLIDSRRIKFVNNICRANLPFSSGSQRWTNLSIVIDGASTINGIRDITISGNTIKNGRIYVTKLKGGKIANNFIDNSELSTAAYAAAYVANQLGYPILLFEYESLTVTGNETIGGFTSIYLQNNAATGTPFCRDTIIADNIFRNAHRWGILGSLGSTGTFQGTIVRNNIVRQDNAATTETGTALTFYTDWFGVNVQQDLQLEGNRIEFNHASGAAWVNSHNATYLARRDNKVNGVYELPAEYADDAAAAAGGVPIGAFYKTGSAIKQRVA